MTPREVLEFAKKNKVVMVDLKFMDFPGLWQHFSIPINALDVSSFEDGVGFDGSSIRGWQAIHASDMLVIPDATTAIMDPFTEAPTLSLICNIVAPIYFGPEAEFFIFDDIRYDSRENCSYYYVDSAEGQWNTGAAEVPNLGYKARYKEGYFPV